jgi:hypothetical protein
MSVDHHQPRSRRMLLTAAVGGAASMVAAAIGRPLEAQAGGAPVLLDQVNDGTALTTIRRLTQGPTLRVQHSGEEVEVSGPALEVGAFWGDAIRVHVGGTAQTAIRTTADIGTALRADAEIGTAVHASGQWAVQANGSQYGVYAAGGTAAVRADASSPGAYALLTKGRIQFGQASGVAVISAGSRQVTVTPAITIGTATKVFTTLQSSAGGTTVVHRISRNIPANSFTIYLTAPATQQCYVAWMLVG